MSLKRYTFFTQECYSCTEDGCTHVEFEEDVDGEFVKYDELLLHHPSDRIMLKRCMAAAGHPEGCGDHSCEVRQGPLKGMGTNGGCRCADALEHYIREMKEQVDHCDKDH